MWQQKHELYYRDEKELEELYRTSQRKYNRFVASIPGRRIAGHRSSVVRAEVRDHLATLQVGLTRSC